MIAKTRHFDPCDFASLDQGHRPVHFDFMAVDDDFFQDCHRSHFVIFRARLARWLFETVTLARFGATEAPNTMRARTQPNERNPNIVIPDMFLSDTAHHRQTVVQRHQGHKPNRHPMYQSCVRNKLWPHIPPLHGRR